MQIPTSPNQKPRHLFNPLIEDFSVPCLDDNNVEHTYTIHGMEVETFPTYLADYIEKHLIDHILNKRGLEPNVELQKKAIQQEIAANLDDE